MGDGTKLPDGTSFCKGDDVIRNLNKWFSNVQSYTYKRAKALQVLPKDNIRPLFQLRDDQYDTTDLAASYRIVGRIHNPTYRVPENWDIYLDSLHDAPSNDPGGLDGYDLIVKARGDALTRNLPMYTKPHLPCEGQPGLVKVCEQKLDRGKVGDPQTYIVISVPYTGFGFIWDSATYNEGY